MLRALEVDPGFKATYDEQGRNTLSRFLLVIGSRGRERLSDSSLRIPTRTGGSLSRGEEKDPMIRVATRRASTKRATALSALPLIGLRGAASQSQMVLRYRVFTDMQVSTPRSE